jgi:transcriptional regulator with XRE-family HTH domain
MTVAVSATSARFAAAQRFGRELDRAMRRRGVGRRRLAETLGMRSASLIAHWRAGNGIPRVVQAARLAEALDAPVLLKISESIRMGNCDLCGKGFVNDGGGPKRFCSERCREVKAKVRSGQPSRLRADLAERRLAEHKNAVEAMCRACEPDGHCHDEKCALRLVSPLPIVAMPLVELATPGRRA